MRLRPDSTGSLLLRRFCLLAVGLLALAAPAGAHEIPSRVTVVAFVRPSGHVLRVVLRVPLEAMRDVEFPLRSQTFIDIRKSEPMLRNAAVTWLADYLTVFEEGRPIGLQRIGAARISLPSDRAFQTYNTALASLSAPVLDNDIDLPWRQAMIDVILEYPIQSDRAHFSVDSRLSHLGLTTTTVLRFLPATGSERVYSYAGNPGTVALDPRWHQAALRFISLGFTHILGGIDHLLFVLCLVIPLRQLRPLAVVITGFTLAHSLTLACSALGLVPNALWFPSLIEVLVAASIVYMALENIVGAKHNKRWVVAFGFGLVHGFAFSFTLSESLQFAGSHLIVSLLAFNIGVELGQLAVLAVAVPLLALVFRKMVAERMGTIILSALIAHTAWHWMVTRAHVLLGYQFSMPSFDASFAVGAMRAAMVGIIAASALWLLSALGERLARPSVEGEIGGP